MSTNRRTPVLAALLVPALALGACAGGDDDMGGDAASNGSATESTTTSQPAVAGGTGSGTFAISGTEFAFEAEPCAIGGDEDQPTVEAEGSGSIEGKDFTVIVKRSPSDRSVIENFQLVFSSAEAMVGTNFVSLPDGADDTAISVDGDTATGTFEFLGTGGRPSGEGTFTLTCES